MVAGVTAEAEGVDVEVTVLRPFLTLRFFLNPFSLFFVFPGGGEGYGFVLFTNFEW